ncbi:LytTR family DNA-binding domain-containing protein [Lachnospiraceae bacterium ZAX-1]
MLHIAICDDNVKYAGEIETLLLQEAKKNVFDIETEVYIDGDELIRDYQDGVRYDFIYLDIEMEKMDGISAAKQIRDMDRTVLIIYLSSHEECCKDLFVYEPVRYIQKPMGKDASERDNFMDTFKGTFLDACKRTGYLGVFFRYSYNKKLHDVALKDIVYFESDNRVVYIHQVGRKHSEYFYGRPLDEIAQELKKSNRRFLRISRSYLVNYDHICDITPFEIFLKDENGKKHSIEIAKNKKAELFQQLGKIHSEGW